MYQVWTTAQQKSNIIKHFNIFRIAYLMVSCLVRLMPCMQIRQFVAPWQTVTPLHVWPSDIAYLTIANLMARQRSVELVAMWRPRTSRAAAGRPWRGWTGPRWRWWTATLDRLSWRRLLSVALEVISLCQDAIYRVYRYKYVSLLNDILNIL